MGRDREKAVDLERAEARERLQRAQDEEERIRKEKRALAAARAGERARLAREDGIKELSREQASTPVEDDPAKES